MSPNICRAALTAALLFISTVCMAQAPVPVPAPTAPGPGTSRSPADGTFRPAASDAVESQEQKGFQSPQQPSPVYTIGKEYRIGPNDLLDVEILNLENAKRTVRVNAAGSITLPLIGAIPVAGLTQQQVEDHIATMYGEKYLQDPQVSVFIREFTTERITVDGAVVKPGIYPLVGQMTLLRVLALAGGFGQIANRSQVMLFRQEDGQRQVATFDVQKIQAGEQPDPPIRGDDLIVVQRDSTRAAFRDSLFRDMIDMVNPFRYLN
jgi:polysaccharide export outer membrane protein